MENKLYEIQKKLKCNKSQYNSFGKYHYRSCEDILEGVKEVLPEGCAVVVTDDIMLVGDRFYVKATAKLMFQGNVIAESNGLAREALSKKGMDDAQVTGSTSSYARKYALNGLFAIDDTKDDDAQEKRPAQKQAQKPAKKDKDVQDGKRKIIADFAVKVKGYESVEDLDAFFNQDKVQDYIKNGGETVVSECAKAYKKKRDELLGA